MSKYTLTEKEKLFDNMTSCYDNGEAMYEYAEPYFCKELIKELNTLKWVGKDCRWDDAITAVIKYLEEKKNV